MLGSMDELRKEIQILDDNNIDTHELVRIADAIEREVSEKYTELPKDASGKTVRYGGYVKVYPYDGKPMKVKALRLSGFGWSVVFEDDSGEHLYRVLACEPPTVEDVLREFALEIDPAADIDVSGAKTIAEYAKRLQIREDE